MPALKAIPGLAGISLEPESSPMFEELNLAWARHELISDHLDEVRRSLFMPVVKKHYLHNDGI